MQCDQKPRIRPGRVDFCVPWNRAALHQSDMFSVQESDQRRASQHDTEPIASAIRDDGGSSLPASTSPRCEASISLFRIRRQQEDLPNAAFLP
jgi:hypothetical protein